MKPTNLRRFIAPAVLLLTGVFITRILFSYSAKAFEALVIIDWGSVILSAFLYLAYFYSRAISWHFILISLKNNIKLKDSLSTWFLGESTRYIPGNIWSYASRIYLGSEKGISKTSILLSLTIEAILMAIIAFVLSLPALFFNYQKISFNFYSLLILLIIVLGGLGAFFLFKKKIAGVVLEIKKIPPAVFKSNVFIKAVALQVVSWVLFGLATFVLIMNLAAFNPVVFISVPILSWLAGYLSFITPMGLGVREGVLIALLLPSLGAGGATLIAVLSRLLLIFMDVLNIGVWLFLTKKKKLEEGLKKALFHWDLVLVCLFILTYIIVFSVFSILRHNSFSSNFDLANMDQTIWNTLHGRIFVMTDKGLNISRLATHADFILVLLAPIYLIWDNVRMLLITQSVFLGIGALPVYLLAKKLLRNKILIVTMPLLYLINPGLQWANIYDFHGVTLAIPFILFAFYFAVTKRWRWYWLFFILALLTKEEISLFLAAMGFFMAVIFRSWKTGLLSFLIGLLWFPIMVFLVIPHFSPLGQHWAFGEWFSGPKQDIDQNNFLDLAGMVVKASFLPQSISYYLLLLKPFGFLPILGLPWILMALPELLINVISTHPGMRSITMHYQSGIIPALVIGLIFSIYYLRMLFNWLVLRKFPSLKKPPLIRFAPVFVSIALVIIAAKFDYSQSPLPFSKDCWCQFYYVNAQDREFEKALKQIPEDASVAASNEVRPHLSHRVNAYNLPFIPQGVDYIALIDRNRVIGNETPHQYELDVIKRLQGNKDYQEVYQSEYYFLYKKVPGSKGNINLKKMPEVNSSPDF